MSLQRIPLNQVFRSKSNSSSSSSSSPVDPPTRDTTPLFASPTRINTLASFTMDQPNGRGGRGTRTPQMLEYERQSEARAREVDKMQEEKERMLEAEAKMATEQERIAQEEYEMRQYYEAQALKHAEEKRAHQEEVRKHQLRVRDHQRRLKDHEASAEAFARLIAMPATPDRTSPILPSKDGGPRGLNGFQNGQAPAQFPGV